MLIYALFNAFIFFLSFVEKKLYIMHNGMSICTYIFHNTLISISFRLKHMIYHISNLLSNVRKFGFSVLNFLRNFTSTRSSLRLKSHDENFSGILVCKQSKAPAGMAGAFFFFIINLAGKIRSYKELSPGKKLFQYHHPKFNFKKLSRSQLFES